MLEPTTLSSELLDRFHTSFAPLRQALPRRFDHRLFRTLLALLQVMLRVRQRPSGLWCTELAATWFGGARTPAGVKRLDRWLTSPQWAAHHLTDWHWQPAVTHLAQVTGPRLVLLDDTEVEKPASRVSAGMTRVRSSKARLLAKSRSGFGGGPPPHRPITVPGYPCLVVTVTGLQGPCQLAAQYWWSAAQPDLPADQRTVETRATTAILDQWGAGVVLVGDRACGCQPFLAPLLDSGGQFVVRWKKRQQLRADRTSAPRPAWHLDRQQRAWGAGGAVDARCWCTSWPAQSWRPGRTRR